MSNNYLFTSKRLGFRNWNSNLFDSFAELNANELVMEHFPNTLSLVETKAFITKFQAHYITYHFTYFAVELKETKEFIGFIRLAYQDYEAVSNPSTDIGWRLKPSAWGNGYATEGAKRCLEYAFNVLDLERITSVCPLSNKSSEHVMKKIGMTKKATFKHPKLKAFKHLEDCVWYEIVNPFILNKVS